MTSDGLVVAYALRDGRGEQLDWDGIRRWQPAHGLLWLHLDYASEAARAWLRQESGLDPVAAEALLADETRPRLAASGDTLLVIVRGVNCNPGADPEDMVSLRLWCDHHRIITMRHRHVMAVEDVKQYVAAGTGPGAVDEFLVTLVGRLTDRIGDVVSDIDERVDELEDLVLTRESHELRAHLARVRRQIISLRRYIAPQRDMLLRLQGERLSWLCDLDRVRIRELAERTAKFVDDLDAARDRAAITQEELNSRLSEQMNKTMYILSIVAAVFLPLGLITGLLGINVGGIPGTDNNLGFTFVTAFLVVLAFLQFLLFKRKRWL